MSNPIPIPSEIEQEIIRLYTSEPYPNLKVLSDQFQISKGRLLRMLKRNCITLRKRNVVSEEEKRLIVQEYKSGTSDVMELAQKYGRAGSCISRILSANIPHDELLVIRKKLNASQGEKLVNEYFENDITQTDLAEKYELSRAAITHRITIAKASNPKYKNKKKSSYMRARAKVRHLRISPEVLYQEIKETKITQRKLAKKYQVSESCIYHAVARYEARTGLDPYA